MKVKEYDIFVPTRTGAGVPVPREVVETIKRTLTERFGGYTHFSHRNEGAWKIGGVTFHDEVTLFRVLGPGSKGAKFSMKKLKKRLEAELDQDEVLIVERAVRVLQS